MAQDSNGNEFYWFFGMVMDRMDPLQLGRVRVRILNYHSPCTKDISNDCLPWAHVIMPVTSASTSGVGESPVGLIEGSWVFGFFKDGKYAQQPVILGSMPGYNLVLDPQNNNHDVKQDDDGEFGGKILINYCDGFKDPREDLSNYPRKIKKIFCPDGTEAEGNKHGLQFEDEETEINPKEIYKNETDVNFNATDNVKRQKTLSELRRLYRSEGGLLDDQFFLPDIPHEEFKAGITNETGISKTPTPSGVISTAYKAIWPEFKPTMEDPLALNDDGEIIYDSSAYTP
jgi:hypothetical protein